MLTMNEPCLNLMMNYPTAIQESVPSLSIPINPSFVEFLFQHKMALVLELSLVVHQPKFEE